jgi:hypothetical protein
MRDLANEYRREFGVDGIDAAAVADWAYKTGRWEPKPYDPVKQCKKDLTRALAVGYEVDPQGREVRSEIAIPIESQDGQLQWEWCPIYKTSPTKFRVAQQLRRSRILADCRQHLVDTESYNDNNEAGAEVDLFDYNFNSDLEEERMPTEYPDEDPDRD